MSSDLRGRDARDGRSEFHHAPRIRRHRPGAISGGDGSAAAGLDRVAGGGCGFTRRGAESLGSPRNSVGRSCGRRYAALLRRAIHGLVVAGDPLPRVRQSRGLHLFFGGLLLPAWAKDTSLREVHPRAGRDGCTHCGQPEHANQPVSPDGCSGCAGILFGVARHGIYLQQIHRANHPTNRECRTRRSPDRSSGGICLWRGSAGIYLACTAIRSNREDLGRESLRATAGTDAG